jgi:hypothetical protein
MTDACAKWIQVTLEVVAVGKRRFVAFTKFTKKNKKHFKHPLAQSLEASFQR